MNNRMTPSHPDHPNQQSNYYDSTTDAPRQYDRPIGAEQSRIRDQHYQQQRIAHIKRDLILTAFLILLLSFVVTAPSWVPYIFNQLDLTPPTTSAADTCGTGKLREGCQP